jgi:hypothetical protein
LVSNGLPREAKASRTIFLANKAEMHQLGARAAIAAFLNNQGKPRQAHLIPERVV